ncbi:MAG: UDP-N-acetylmuramate--alanine ligase, partial [Chitinivibrionales bacterium]|nr:UDP-N-acetylmuramate--alanine ligase [Chitinivibrionales bacterium]MBD3396024.1 UDP-N-acetylmuramate--alanine ligase [Chitinivibrionales bacterium]
MSLSISGMPCVSVHFAGILGSGMSALAQYLAWEGLAVTGSDRLRDAGHTAATRTKLEALGCRVCAQDGSGVTARTDAVVVSTAIEKDNPDVAAARARSIPVFHRSDVLAAAVASKHTIAVAGTSGKSTVTAMVFHLLRHAGKDPSLIAGANLHDLIAEGFVGNAFHGSSGLLVVEADESDGSLVKYHPAVSVFLNLSRDHQPEDETLAMFRTLAVQSGEVIVNADDPRLDALQADARFGTAARAQYRASLSSDAGAARVTVESHAFEARFPGMHMAQNLLASLCVCMRLGVDQDTLARGARAYAGIARRFDRTPTKRGITVIDDYAHNPDKVR